MLVEKTPAKVGQMKRAKRQARTLKPRATKRTKTVRKTVNAGSPLPSVGYYRYDLLERLGIRVPEGLTDPPQRVQARIPDFDEFAPYEGVE